ncbi:MAG TPA: SDR family NAD(P)-dependent oxidoreductase [Ramlibacter sp.]|nr:SDR family NAD(P)-dependent oxidoreductase [Ramlibacter sp.]
MKSLDGKIVVITGAGSGIGRAIALALAGAGSHVVVADIQAEKAEAVADEVRGRGVRTLAVSCDVSDAQSVMALADRAYAEFGRVDILCNNAGISMRPYRGIAETTMQDWHVLYGVNLWGVVHGLQAFLPRMKRQPGEKHVVNTASLAGLVPMESHAIYSSSKAAVVNLSEALAREVAPHGIGVTILCPGPVPTNLKENLDAIRGADRPEQQRTYETILMPTFDRMASLALTCIEPVGAMVCNAILDNAMYLHTAAMPGDWVAERTWLQYGPHALGRTCE